MYGNSSELRQFIPTTQGLPQCEFAYKGDNYKKKGKRVNDNVDVSSQESIRPNRRTLISDSV
ncbi:hypothetical protein Golob_024397 [Gossypium lobatum]|uniref:Uncharacterized protein n=1 Tax=Gossypium lobatum TaxID=34289 RepID=A0A7J8NJQ6_9ROSI|nr:hypothetical protein [Gossypium lobatum]